MRRAQKGNRGSKFIGRAKAPRGNGGFALCIDDAQRYLPRFGHLLTGAAQPVGIEWPGQDAIYGDVVSGGLAREHGDRTRETEARAVGELERSNRMLDRRGGDVDDTA